MIYFYQIKACLAIDARIGCGEEMSVAATVKSNGTKLVKGECTT